MKLKCCPFDGCTKFRPVGIEGSNAQECLKCHHILVLRPREDGKFFQWQVLVYDTVMHAASECPMEFQTSLMF
jgi:hypothetical protein